MAGNHGRNGQENGNGNGTANVSLRCFDGYR